MENRKKEMIQKTIESNNKMVEMNPEIERNIELTKNEIVLPTFRFYRNPFRRNQKTEYCYMTILFMNEKYVPSILTLGGSLRKKKVKHNLVCLFQDKSYKDKNGNIIKGVSKETINDIMKIYDYVIGCDLLEIENYTNPKFHFSNNKHYENKIQYYVTKLNILGMTQYKKIFYLDASTIVEKNCDYMFHKFNKSAFFFDKEYKLTNVGLRGTFVFIVPNIDYFIKSIYLIQNYNQIFHNFYFCRGVDEYLLYYSIYPNWSSNHIDFEFACDGNKTQNNEKENCNIYYFQIFKPFEPILNQPMDKIKQMYQNYQRWDDVVKSILDETPQMNVYFKPISNFRNTSFF